MNARAAAAQLCRQIIDKGQSLDQALDSYFSEAGDNDRGLIQEMVYGVCRWYGALDHTSRQLLQRPIKPKDRVIHFVLLVGIYQLQYLNTAQHAAVSESVNACRQLNRPWAKNLINGCLRTWLRDPSKFSTSRDSAVELSHPLWLRDAIKEQWPDHSAAILSANNKRPPMVLRSNQIQNSRSAYLEKLQAANLDAAADHRSEDAICLHQAVPVIELPEFFDGAASVQDVAAQIAADILAPKAGQRVLDACAAPGGKAAHLQERAGNLLQLDALDIAPKRVDQIRDTFSRLQIQANIYEADATAPPTWETPDDGYDAIVIDAPCSGTGVIRRHPDIKHHRQPADIDLMVQTQKQLLSNLWPQLKAGGQLLYMTCSILPQENHQQVAHFLSSRSDARLKPFTHPDAIALEFGWQTLQGVHNMDGFFYSLIEKVS